MSETSGAAVRPLARESARTPPASLVAMSDPATTAARAVHRTQSLQTPTTPGLRASTKHKLANPSPMHIWVRCRGQLCRGGSISVANVPCARGVSARVPKKGENEQRIQSQKANRISDIEGKQPANAWEPLRSGLTTQASDATEKTTAHYPRAQRAHPKRPMVPANAKFPDAIANGCQGQVAKGAQAGTSVEQCIGPANM